MSWFSRVAAATITLLLATGSISAPAAGSTGLQSTNGRTQALHPQQRIYSHDSTSQARLIPTGPEPPLHRAHPSHATLQITQYARKDPIDHQGDAGRYHITASVINSTAESPNNGALLGSTHQPRVASDDQLSFTITTDQDTHNVVIHTAPLRWKMVDPDSVDLEIDGFLVRGWRISSSDPQCDVGRWQLLSGDFGRERIPTLGETRRHIRCYM